MTREIVGIPLIRLVALALSAILVAAACVSISLTPTDSPRSSRAPLASGTPTAPASPTPIGQPSTTPGSTTPATTPTTGPSGPATPGPTIDPALAAQIDAVIAQVPAIRQLESLADVPYEFITRQQFRDDLIELQFEEVPEETLRAEERLLKRLGLVPDDADLLQQLVDLYGGQVAAYYRPDTKRFYIIQNDRPFGPADKIIVAHEYTHALQDQHFDLEGTRIKDLSQGDGILGQLGAIEGDATLTMQLWSIDNLSAEEQFQVLIDSIGQLEDPALANMPPVLRRQLEYPYVEGFSFIQGLYDVGGYDAVNATLKDAIPASTEQVLHPEKYLANEAPVHLAPPGAMVNLANWRAVYEQTFGELLMQVWAAGEETPPETIPGLPVEWPHAEVASGWGGDALVMFEKADGSWAIVWRTAWDSAADADEFRTRFAELASMFDGPSAITAGFDADMVQVVIASDDDALRALNTLNL
ncbi:MAG: hypothetical protein ACR2H0_05295 [Candidatus Limnocylindrales bacterium]